MKIRPNTYQRCQITVQKVVVFFLFLLSQPLAFAYSLEINAQGKIFKFNADQLHKINLQHVTTKTSWTINESTFSGIYVHDLFEYLNIKSAKLRLLALNNYLVTVDLATLSSYDAFIATHQDDRALTIRNKGLYWVIFPVSQRPELANKEIDSLSVWQLKNIDVLNTDDE